MQPPHAQAVKASRRTTLFSAGGEHDVILPDSLLKYASMWDAQEAFVTFVFTTEHALRIATTLLEECDVRSLVQAQRHAAMSLLQTTWSQ